MYTFLALAVRDGLVFLYMDVIKYTLNESQMPTAWYNIQADLPVPIPAVLNPGTRSPITGTDLEALFPCISEAATDAIAAVFYTKPSHHCDRATANLSVRQFRY